MPNILVIGGGSWGTAFANYLASVKNLPVRLWLREKEIHEQIRTESENKVFLPGKKLSNKLLPVLDLSPEVKQAEILVLAVPSKYIRNIFTDLASILPDKMIINLSKGFEAASMLTISQLAADVLGPRILENWATISGPSFARELAQDFPTAVAAASKNSDWARKIQTDFSSGVLRIYSSSDLTGIEVGGSLKNIIAIASGITHGLGFGYNTTSTLVTRANMEISRFGKMLGARLETFWGLAGIGDLMLTCFGPLSRNFQLGVRLAKGETLAQIEGSMAMVAEGVETTQAIHKLAEKLKIDMPICDEVYRILFDKENPRDALIKLMKRSLKSEWILN